jgi:hypothetical protein
LPQAEPGRGWWRPLNIPTGNVPDRQRETQMHELSGILTFIVRTVEFVWDMVLFVSNSRKLASMWTGSDKLVAVPAEAKILSPAAQRALAEAERRNQFLCLPRR